MTETSKYPAAAILDTWAAHAWDNGIQVESVDDFTEVIVETLNSRYEITVIDGRAREVLVRGGKFFPEKTAVRLAGCSLRGSFLKLGGIYVGFNLEFNGGGQTIITSTIQTITVLSQVA